MITAILVHGTFAREAPWTLDESLFRKTLQTEMETDVRFETFLWSGANSPIERLAAAQELGITTNRLREQQGAGQTIAIIGHSHGGNVALMSLRFARPDSLVCISTPFIDPKRRFSSEFREQLEGGSSKLFVWLYYLCLVGWGFIFVVIPTRSITPPVFVLGFVIFISGTIALFNYYSNLRSWFESKLSGTIRWISQQYERSQVSYIAGSDTCNILAIQATRDEARTWLGVISLFTRLVDFVRTVLFFCTFWMLKYAPIAIGLLFLVFTLKDLGAEQLARMGFVVLAAAFRTFFYGFAGYVLFEVLSIVVLFPIQSWLPGFGFEGWGSFFLYRYRVTSAPRVASPLYIETVSRNDLPRGLRHSAIYQDPPSIKVIAKWIVNPQPAPALTEDNVGTWIDSDNYARKLARIVTCAVVLFLSILFWFHREYLR